MVVEPLVGTRVFDSLAILDETMKLVWGPEGVNVEKMAEEGEPSSTQLLWGLHMNFENHQVRLPEPARVAAKCLLGEPGKRVLRGPAWAASGSDRVRAILDRALTPHLLSLYRLLKGNLQGQGEKEDQR